MKLNGSASPLLRLPPEIRNRILAYALGGEHIHLFTYSQKTALTHGRRPKSTVEMDGVYNTTAGVWNNGCGIGTMPPPGRHDRCISEWYSIAPLLVCRQIYTEACLLPYALNIWSFDWTYVLTRFLRRLQACQRRALRMFVTIYPPAIPVREGENLEGIDTLFTWLKDSDFAYHWGPRTAPLRLPANADRLIVQCDNNDLISPDSYTILMAKKAVKEKEVAAKKLKKAEREAKKAILATVAVNAAAAPAA